MKDIGQPRVRLIYLPATPESVARNRANLTMAVEAIESRLQGCPVKVKINFGEKPEHYGEDTDWRTVDINQYL